MKKFLLMASLAAGLISCSDNNSTQSDGTVTDTADHSGPHNTDATTPATATRVDTAGMSGKTMMSIMQSNMNQMKAVPTTGNADNDYAALMKIHHMGAVEMAQLELVNGTDPQVKSMAQKMLDAQQQEIATLNSFLSGHSAHGGGDAFYKTVMAGMNGMKMDMDHGGSVDRQFVQMMIPHHQGAIDMSNTYIKAGGHEEQMKTMASRIIADQQKEIRELQAWLEKNK
jgi:uncharacterized protein (DUF305 family)